jgi:hypothetical protein
MPWKPITIRIAHRCWEMPWKPITIIRIAHRCSEMPWKPITISRIAHRCWEMPWKPITVIRIAHRCSEMPWKPVTIIRIAHRCALCRASSTSSRDTKLSLLKNYFYICCFIFWFVCSHACDVTLLGNSVDVIKKKTETLLGTVSEVGVKVKTEKTTFMVLYGHQMQGKSRADKSFAENSSKKPSTSDCYCELRAQKPLSSCLLSRNANIKLNFVCCFIWVWNLDSRLQRGP